MCKAGERGGFRRALRIHPRIQIHNRRNTLSFKSKLGSALNAGFKVVKIAQPELAIVDPLISAISPQAGAVTAKAESEIGQIVGIVGIVESFQASLKAGGGSLTPEQQRSAAANMVAQVFLRSSAVAGHDVKDKDKFAAAMQTIAGGFADALDALDESGIQVG